MGPILIRVFVLHRSDHCREDIYIDILKQNIYFFLDLLAAPQAFSRSLPTAAARV
jgi:hypothetical protein